MADNIDLSNNFDLDKFVKEVLWDETDEEMGRYLLQQYENSSRKEVDRDRVAAAARLYQDYFSPQPIFYGRFFRRRFRMRKELFIRIVDALGNHFTYFQQRVDAAKRLGLSPLKKCTAALRILAYGTPTDAVDEYIKIGETTAIQCVSKFCRAIIEVFGEVYMRKPNANDVKRLVEMHEECHGFPAVASVDLWIWHAYFGVAGSNNDLNVLSRSNLFQEKLQGIAPDVHFTVNGTEYNMGYYLVDGIYPEWAAFVKSFPHPRDPKRLLFKEKQESARKDVERAFGVLQSRFAIVRGPARSWHKERLHDIMDACIILHNMIVEDERHTYGRNFINEDFPPIIDEDVQQGYDMNFEAYMARNATIRDREMHHLLKSDLVEHICKRFEVNTRNDVS